MKIIPLNPRPMVGEALRVLLAEGEVVVFFLGAIGFSIPLPAARRTRDRPDQLLGNIADPHA
ncbi:MAG TPA: hypothetical protein VHW05_16715 [Phenylobacterium sp.]|jgi:hypothetical protein|nr:hypothetical protein [Phenylobacterium sp.]